MTAQDRVQEEAVNSGKARVVHHGKKHRVWHRSRALAGGVQETHRMDDFARSRGPDAAHVCKYGLTASRYMRLRRHYTGSFHSVACVLAECQDGAEAGGLVLSVIPSAGKQLERATMNG